MDDQVSEGNPMTKSGWLVKRGGLRKNWKRRFVAVEPGLNDFSVLRYFDKEVDFTATKAKQLGRFELVSDTKVLVYRNLVKALPWFTQVRVKIEDPRFWGFFLRKATPTGDDATGQLYLLR